MAPKGTHEGSKEKCPRSAGIRLAEARSLRAADDRAGQARAGVAGRLRLVVVRVAVDDEPLADDVRGAAPDRHSGDIEARLGIAGPVGAQVGHVADVAFA